MSQHDPNNDDNDNKRPSSYLTTIPNQTIHDDQAPRIRPRETTHHHPKMSDVVQRFRQNMKPSSSPTTTVSLLNNPNVSVKEAEQRMLERIRMKKRKKNDQVFNE